MKIRQEKSADYNEVYELVKIAFAANSDDDGTVPDYLNQVRKKDTFIPELSLVAENENEKIIGQIVLYKMSINTAEGDLTELLLSPVSVHPDYFRRGIARAMVKESFRIAKNMGYKAVFLCGDPELYKKLGFKPTFEYNIFHVSDKEKTAPWCMVCEFVKDALKDITGTVDIV